MAESRTIPATAFATQREIPVSAVVSRIRRGIYDGHRVDGAWVVTRGTPPRRHALRAASRAAWRRRTSGAGWIAVTVAGLAAWTATPPPAVPVSDAAVRMATATGVSVPDHVEVRLGPSAYLALGEALHTAARDTFHTAASPPLRRLLP